MVRGRVEANAECYGKMGEGHNSGGQCGGEEDMLAKALREVKS